MRLQLIIFLANLSFALRRREAYTLASLASSGLVFKGIAGIIKGELTRGNERTIIYTQYIFNSLLVFYVLTVCVFSTSSPEFLGVITSTTPTPYI